MQMRTGCDLVLMGRLMHGGGSFVVCTEGR